MAACEIPLHTVVSHGHLDHSKRSVDSVARGVRSGDEKMTLNSMGEVYQKVLKFSIITRYVIYIVPLALALAVPIILVELGVIRKHASIGGKGGPYLWALFTWLEIVWLSLWACKIVAQLLPHVFAFFVGVVSPGTKKYVQLLAVLEQPISFVFWSAVNQVTYQVLIVQTSRGDRSSKWMDKAGSFLLALLVCACIALAERVLVRLISISYHRRQFETKIQDSKRNVHLLSLIYDTSRAIFPDYCSTFTEEDNAIHDRRPYIVSSGKAPERHKQAGSKMPVRLLRSVDRAGGKVASVLGTVTQEITGKKALDPNSAHSIVLTALESERSAQALAQRIYLSFVTQDSDVMCVEDVASKMGADCREQAEAAFGLFDEEGNGTVSLQEMTAKVFGIRHERNAIVNSLHDVDQAIDALDALLTTIVSVVCIFVVVCFLSQGFTTTLATSATALISLSFVFAATCQEVLGSCIFLFVKHPYDIGDRVSIESHQLIVEHICLLYSIFTDVDSGNIVQAPNIVLNGLWVDNVTRRKAVKEQVSVFWDLSTFNRDVRAIERQVDALLRDPRNGHDMYPDIGVEVVGIETDKVELRVTARYKNSCYNENACSSRRSTLMSALITVLRNNATDSRYGSGAAANHSFGP